MANVSALDFERSSNQFGYVNSTSTPAFAPSSYTIEAWVKVEAFVSGLAQAVLAKCGPTNDKQFMFGVGASDGSSQRAIYHEHYQNDGETVMNMRSANDVLTAGQWAHIVVVNNAGTFTMYVNGVASTVTTLSGSYAAMADQPTQLRIGERLTAGGADDTDSQFDGTIDEVRFWNYARTPAQILANYNKHLVGNEVGLVGYWRLDENTGTTAYDATGSGYDFLLQNTPTWASAAFTDSQNFANTHSLDLELGSNQYVKLADNATMSFTGSGTWMCWIKVESMTATMSLMSKYDSGDNRRSWSIRILGSGSGAIQFAVSSNGSSATTADSNYSFFPDYSTGISLPWFHIAVTYNAAAGTCKFYINGVLDSVGSSLATSIHNNTSDFRIGADDNTSGSGALVPFDGRIKDVRIFSSELSASQVIAEMLSINSTNSPVGHWKLNNDLTDASGNGQTLTAVGSPVFVPAVPFGNAGVTVELQASADAFIDDSGPTTNFGTNTGLGVGENNGGAAVQRSALKFDYSAIPATADINFSMMALSMIADRADNARIFNVFRLKRAWVENQITWNIYSTGNSWGTAGGSNASDREQDRINEYHAQVSAPDTTNGRKGIILDRQRIKELIDGTMTNNGFMVQVNNESNDQLEYASSNHATSALRPVMYINYTAPDAGGGMAIIVP